MIQQRKARIEAKKAKLADELVDLARNSHWKKARSAAILAAGLSLRFDSLASAKMIDLAAKGTVDSNPALRETYSRILLQLFRLIDVRAMSEHKYENYILDKRRLPSWVQVTTNRHEPGWTERFVSSFALPQADYYVDDDYPGWLVWDKTMPVYQANIKHDIEYDSVEWKARETMGKIFDRR
jgi:proteasome activator subunit 4